MRMRKTLTALLVVAVAACGGGDPADPTTPTGGDEVTIRATEFTFSPDDIEVPANKPVTIILVNDGVVEHDISIESVGLNLLAKPGETVRQTVTFSAGTYDVHCTVPGHHEAGMTGVLNAR